MTLIKYGALVGAAVALALLIIWALASSMAAHAAWETWCADQGGRVVKDTDTSTGVGYGFGSGNGSGGVVVTTTTNTDYYCLSETGGILDIR